MLVTYNPTAGGSNSDSSVMAGDVIGTISKNTIKSTAVTSKLLTGLVSMSGTVSAGDSILSAIGKLSSGNQTSIQVNAIESLGSTLNIASQSTTQTLNIGSGSGVQTINMGNSGAGATTINLGGASDTVNIAGTLTTVNTTNTQVIDKSLVLNSGGAAASSGNSGIYFEEDGDNASSFIRVGSDRTKIEMKPAAGNLITLNQSLRTSDGPNFATVTSNGNLVVAGTGAVVYSNQSNTRKRVVIYERGDPLSNSDHRFDGFGKIASEMVYQVGGGEHVFYYATSATSSIEMMRIAWNYVNIPSMLNVAGNINLPSVSSNINFSNLTSSRKRIVLYERGVATDPNDHRFDGIGKIASEMVFQVGNGDFVYYYATSATASNELFRIAGTGAVSIPGTLAAGISTIRGTGPQILLYPSTDNLESSVKFNANLAGTNYWSMGQNAWSVGGGNFGIGCQSGLALKIDTAKAVTLSGALTVNGSSIFTNGASVQGALNVQYNVNCGSVVFAAAGATPLSYFEEFDFSTVFTGPFTTGDIRIKISKVGRTVNLTFRDGYTNSGSSTGAYWSNSTLIPARFCPSEYIINPIHVRHNGAYEIGALIIYPGGTMIIQPRVETVHFVGAGTHAFNTMSITYQGSF